MPVSLVIPVLMRFLHIGSVTLFLGAVVYARLAFQPALEAIGTLETRRIVGEGAQTRFRSWLYALLVVIVGSGLYQFLNAPRHTSVWHMWFGIKMLLVLHILATAVLWATSPAGDIAVEGRGKRRSASLAISGVLVVLISAILRSLTWMGR